MTVENRFERLNSLPVNPEETVYTDCEDEDIQLDEETLRIMAEPTEAEIRYQEMVAAGTIEEVDWDDPKSVSEYCHTMYRIRQEIYGIDFLPCLKPEDYKELIDTR